ncbi:hypothetical protein Tco_1297978 [Tanacetum coccineum]
MVMLTGAAWYLDDGTIVGDTLVVEKVLELIMKDGLRLKGVFPSNIARPSHGVKLLGGPASVDFDFCSQLVMKRVDKTIALMDAVAKINDPQCELLLLRSCTVLLDQGSETSNGGLPPYHLLLGGLSAGLQTELRRHTSILAFRPNFDDALRVFNTSMKTDFLSNPNEIAAPKLMMKMADINYDNRQAQVNNHLCCYNILG